MSFRVFIVPDKFKGTLTAFQAAEAIATGWKEIHPEHDLELLPMSDGGDGFGEVMSLLLDGKKIQTRTLNAAHQPITTHWYFSEGKKTNAGEMSGLGSPKTAIIESARVVGLAMLPFRKFHPFKLDTEGLGKVLWAAEKKGAEQCLVGVGGSATNDGGFGLAKSLGWKFFTESKTPIEEWIHLDSLDHVEPPVQLLTTKIMVAVDVQNKLLGKKGCSRVYGPQKGLRSRDFPHAEACLSRLNTVLEKYFGRELGAVPGTGAAGGLSFGLHAFCGASLVSGFDLFAQWGQLRKKIESADLVITAEGALDNSTLMGKGVGEVARLCGELRKPCIGLGGVVRNHGALKKHFHHLRGLLEFTNEKEARADATQWLKHTAMESARFFVGQASTA